MLSSTSQITSNPAQYKFSGTSDVSQETFFKLLSAELQNQDPMEPLTSKDMMEQVTQLSMVTQLTNLNNVLSASSKQTVADVATLLGRQVEWTDATTGETVSGLVTRVERDGDSWKVVVGEHTTDIKSLTSVQ